MKLLLLGAAGLVSIGLIAYIVMAVLSHKVPESLGLQGNQLRPCPESPNCVCSEAHAKDSKQHDIEPFSATLDHVKHVILQQGGQVVSEQKNYLHATFTTSVFRYVDDVELRYDADKQLVHIRSASRIGRSDFGENRKRVNAIKAAL
jgi:uncharacterized protein (DUF1499 family)